MKSIHEFSRIWLYNGVVDFCKQIDGLAGLVKENMGLSPFESALFVFVNRHRNRVKILNWDATGFALWFKRLEKEKFAKNKSLVGPHQALLDTELSWLLEGHDIWKMKPHQRLNLNDIG